MPILNFLLNPINFISTEADDASLGFMVTVLALILIVFGLIFTGLFWLGGLSVLQAFIAGGVAWVFWFTGNGRPIMASALLCGLLFIGGDYAFKLLSSVGLPENNLQLWMKNMSFSAGTLAFSTLYFFTIWPLASIRQAIWPR